MKNQKPNKRYVWSNGELKELKVTNRRRMINVVELQDAKGEASVFGVADTHESKTAAICAALNAAKSVMERIESNLRNFKEVRAKQELIIDRLTEEFKKC